MKIKYIITSALLFFAIFPALISIFLSAAYFKEHVQASLVTTLTTATNIEASNISNYFRTLSSHIDPLHSIPLLKEYLLHTSNKAPTQSSENIAASISAYLHTRTTGRSDILRIVIINCQGTVLASSTPQERGTPFPRMPAPQSFADTPYLLTMLPDTPATGKNRFGLMTPLHYESQQLGFMYVEYTTTYFETTLREIAICRSGSMFLLDFAGKIIATSRPTGVGKNITNTPALEGFSKTFYQENFSEHPSGMMFYTLNGTPRIAVFQVIAGTQWVLMSAMDNQLLATFLRNFDVMLLFLCAALLILSTIGSLLISQRIVAPVEMFIATIKRIKDGDHAARFHYTKSNELGMIADAFNDLVRTTNTRTDKLTQQQQQLETLTHNIPGGLFRCTYDRKGTFSFISAGYLDILSFNRESFIERCENCLSLTIHPDKREAVMDDILDQLAQTSSCEVTYLAMMGFGSTCWIQLKGELKVDALQGSSWIDGLATDVTEQVQAQEHLTQTMEDLRETLHELKISEERLRLIIVHSSDVVVEWSATQRYVYLSTAFERRFGYMPLLPNGYRSLMQFKGIHPKDLRNFRAWISKLAKGIQPPVADFRFRTADERFLWTRLQLNVIRDKDENIVRAVGLLADVHENKCAELQLLNKAERDPLSGLLNRATFTEKAQAALLNSQGNPVALAFMFLDIDNFRHYNTEYGHAFGDRIISFVGKTLQESINYKGFAGRQGGDEFVICCEHGTSEAQLRALAVKIRDQLNAGLPARNHNRVRVSCSTGIVQVTNPQLSFEKIINAADQAMYEVKNAGKGSYCIVQI
ncbi:MAG: diguanylate cyclase [Desulfovibrionaceae bacterium]